MGLAERIALERQRFYPPDARIAGKIDLEAPCAVDLGQQVDVRQTQDSKAKPLVAYQRLDGLEPLTHPVANPLQHSLLIVPKRPQPVDHRQVVQRMNIAADDRCYGAVPGARFEIARQQRRLRIALLEVLDDGRRLDKYGSVIRTQARDPRLRVHGAVVGAMLLTAVTQQMNGNMPAVQPLEFEHDAYAVRSGRTVIGVEIHATATAVVCRIAGTIVIVMYVLPRIAAAARHSPDHRPRAADTMARHSPKPIETCPSRTQRARRMISSPSSRKVRVSPPGSARGALPPSVSSSRLA